MDIIAKQEMMDPRLVPSSKSMGTLRYMSRLDAHLRYPRRFGIAIVRFQFLVLVSD
jgi:hypothetical protein